MVRIANLELSKELAYKEIKGGLRTLRGVMRSRSRQIESS